MSTTDREKVNILLVDDQPAKLMSYEVILGELGENLIKASSGREALEHLLKTDITVVLMDVSMPELDGFELANIIREHPRFQQTAIIFVSGVHLADFDRLRAYELGAVDYVSVPVVPEILRARVRVFVDLYRKTQQFERLNRELEQRVAERTAALEASTGRLAELTAHLQEADRRKDEFLALLAHELRNPLAPLRNAVEIMRRAPAGDEQAEWCREVIGRQVDQLTRLVDDLLDVSRITRGQILLQRETVDLTAVAADAIETSRPLIDKSGHQLAVDLPDRPLWVDGDRARLTQVLANLLNNAAKYQDEGGRISLRLERGDGEAVIRVVDEGIGIDAHLLPKMFDMFSQREDTLHRAQGGLGIGLSLVKKLVELHGGSVQVESRGPGEGSEFIVRLPRLAEAPRATRAEAAPAEAAGRSRRILIVDDNLDAAESLAMLLQHAGHEVLMAHDGPTAIELAMAQNPPVILLDVRLPGMSGYDVCRHLRKQGLTQTLMVAVTGFGREQDRNDSREAGCDAHIVKPVKLHELLGILDAYA